MNNKYEDKAKKFKALADVNRLKIFELLAYEEKCGCDILEHFEFTQSTLSHHMKVLIDSKLVKCRKDGHWSLYSVDNTGTNELLLSVMNHGAETNI